MASLRPVLSLFVSSILLAGCGVLLSEEPIGEPAAGFDPAEANGTWLGPYGTLYVLRIVDVAKGTVAIWQARRNAADKLRCEVSERDQQDSEDNICALATCVVTRHPKDPTDWVYVTSSYLYLLSDVRSGWPTWTLAAGETDGKSFVLAYPVAEDAPKRLRQLIEKGQLPGRADPREHGDVILGKLAPEHYSVILSRENGLFDWNHPVPYLKLPPDLDPCKKSELQK